MLPLLQDRSLSYTSEAGYCIATSQCMGCEKIGMIFSCFLMTSLTSMTVRFLEHDSMTTLTVCGMLLVCKCRRWARMMSTSVSSDTTLIGECPLTVSFIMWYAIITSASSCGHCYLLCTNTNFYWMWVRASYDDLLTLWDFHGTQLIHDQFDNLLAVIGSECDIVTPLIISFFSMFKNLHFP